MTDDEKRPTTTEDSQSDPAESEGANAEQDQTDWSGEGGATPEGPATDTED